MILTAPAVDTTCSGHGQVELPPVSGQQRRNNNDPDHTVEEEQLHRKIAKMLRLGNQPFTYEIRKQSLDARHKEDKKFVYTVDIKLDNESRVLKKVHDKNIMLKKKKKYHL